MSVRSSRTVLVVALSVMALLAGVMAAFGAGSDAPPRMAFVARGDGANFADALAAGSVAGQFGAPVFTTPRDSLASATETALEEYAPEVVVILGGTGAISEGVELAVLEATGLPADQVIRAQGANRYATAAEIADLVDSIGGVTYSRAWLPVNGQAADADLLDGFDSSAFLGASDQAVDSDTVDGVHADAFDLRPTVLNISPLAFIAESGTPVGSSSSGALSGSGCAHAPVDVPVGATITSLTAWVYDWDSSSLTLTLKADTPTSNAVTIAEISSTAEIPATLSYTDDTVDAPPAGDETTYFLATCMGNPALHGVQLTLAYS